MSTAEPEVGGPARVALALAGGGPEGAVWEIGALFALDESIEGLELHRLPMYVGVSAGAFIASALANGITPAQLCRAVVKTDPGEHPFRPETFFGLAGREFVRGTLRIPRLLLEAASEGVRRFDELSLRDALTRLARALPSGVFSSEPIRRFLATMFERPGRTDDFRRLGCRLIVVATDLDSGHAVLFGAPGLEHVPISLAVQASLALPGLYPPVTIEGRHYVDGVLLKTMHASVALDEGAELVLCVNPIVPVDTIRSVDAGVMRRGKLVDRGLPTILSQTFRTLIHSRLVAGMGQYDLRYHGADVLLFEPRRDDYDMFFTNVFGLGERRRVVEHAYRSTRHDLLARAPELAPRLERHGLRLRRDLLDEEDRDLWRAVGLHQPRRREHPIARRLDLALQDLEGLLDAED